MKKTYFTNSERSVTLNARLFRTIENLGVGGIERAVHHDGQDDREGHYQHDRNGGLAEK